MKKGLYIHIPFCRSKCKYCDFKSYSGREKDMPEYFSCLEKELLGYKTIFNDRNYKIGSVFIGGGTPTLADEKYIVRIMDIVHKEFSLEKCAEVTIEANPGTVKKESLKCYISSGINRISFGLQTADDTQLKALGRIHSYSDYLKSMELARNAGFKNINTDLIIGVPYQDFESFADTLERVAREKPQHLSCYSLIVEENTPFYEMQQQGRLELPEDEQERQMYHHAVNFLKSKGYGQYEISNFAEEGCECRHNLIYWKAEEYIGVGAAAHSYFDNYRYSNQPDISEYIKAVKCGRGLREQSELITGGESMKEYMMLGLRLIKGVRADEFVKRYNKNMYDIFQKEIDKLVTANIIRADNGGIRLTEYGLDFANIAFMEFV